FTLGTPVNPGGEDWKIVAGDFNEDGFVDLAAVGSGSMITFFYGNGDGTFQPPNNFSTGSFYPNVLATGDFNGDGHLDLAVGAGEQVFILLGDGTGSFTQQTETPALISVMGGSPFPFPFPLFVESIAVGDFNNDGKLDVLAFGENGPF